MKATLLIKNIGELVTPTGTKAAAGEDMSKLKIIKDAAILINVERIVWVGPENELPKIDGVCPEVIDAGANAVVPGFVDSHTHFIFGGYRDEEFLWRAGGVPYMEIHNRGGGIANSVKATRDASLNDMLAIGTKRLLRMLELGVTTVEGKSGYGLDFHTELRQLEAMKILENRQPVDIVPTFMGAHSVPQEYKGRAGEYLDWIVSEVLPHVKSQGIAKFCDIFCEKGVFEIEESRKFLKACQDAGYKIKLHADEIVPLGGAGLAAELGAISADHLLKASTEDMAKMAQRGVVATLLPLTAFTLREPYANAREMIRRNCAVALSSDLNPGSCYSQSIPLIFALAVLYMNMSLEESLTALTLNGAAALGLAHDRGSIEKDKLADILILEAPSYRHLAYHTGMNVVNRVIKSGKLVSKRN